MDRPQLLNTCAHGARRGGCRRTSTQTLLAGLPSSRWASGEKPGAFWSNYRAPATSRHDVGRIRPTSARLGPKLAILWPNRATGARESLRTCAGAIFEHCLSNFPTSVRRPFRRHDAGGWRPSPGIVTVKGQAGAPQHECPCAKVRGTRAEARNPGCVPMGGSSGIGQGRVIRGVHGWTGV